MHWKMPNRMSHSFSNQLEKAYPHSLVLLSGIAWLLFSFVLPSICGAGEYFVVGRNQIDIIQWERMPPAEALVSIADANGQVREGRAKYDQTQGLYSQAFKLRNGSILYERREGFKDGLAALPEEEIINRYANHPELAAKGLSLHRADIKKKTNQEGDIFYVVTESPVKRCFIFFRYADGVVLHAREGDSHYQAVTGAMCVDPEVKSTAALEKEGLDLAGRILFDGGEDNRRQLFTEVLAKLEQKVR